MQSEETNSDVFVHDSSIASEGYRTLTQGQPVKFEIEDGEKGVHAINVKIQQVLQARTCLIFCFSDLSAR
ncbi:MAG: cold shock domain-containing protein [Candidatus Omnitrophica bacterium]|nr:cold shock domain-containing protein [Candidatus Omnitrophota bacterium]